MTKTEYERTIERSIRKLTRVKRRLNTRRIKRFIRTGLLTLSFVVAMVIFVLASFQTTLANPFGILAMVLSGGYILAFWSANDDE